MATLYFKVSSDWQEVVRLRQECEKLETQLKKMDSRTAPAATKALETQLASTKQQMMGLVTEAAKAGAAVENDFKKKIYDASQTVNGLSEKIIAQRAVIKDIEFDVKRLGDAYRAALKNNPIGASGKLSEYNAARKALDEEKAALFGLTQQQAEARLSVKKLRDEYSLYKKEAGDTVEINNGLSVSWGKMLGVIGGVTALKQLGSEIVRVRGEFQSMQTAIETMVGKDMASTLIPQIKELAKVSPLTLSDMVNAEKMMLGFNIQAEDTIRYLQALSDISMGDGNKFKSLTLAFSQMSAAGKLMGQDLNQMINAGFNPLQIIAEKTGKSIATLKDEMSKGAVSAEMVQQAFIAATSAGGKFYQMSENASKTINGQLSMMQDALDAAFNEMGQASEGVIMGAIQATTSLIQNYETVGRVMAGLVVTYGAYRAAVMLSTVATSKHTIAEVALTNVRVLARKAQMALNAAMLTNPYVALATVITGLVATMWTLSDSTSQTEEATKRLNKSVSNVEGMASKEMSALKNLNKQLNEAKKGTDEWNKVKNQIVDGYSKYLPGIDKEIEKTGNLAGKYNELEVAIRKAAAARSFNEIERTENAKYQEIRDKNLEKAYDAFIESYGDESGLEIYKNFLGWLDSGKELPAEVQKAFSSVSVGWDKTANSLLFEIRKQDELRKQNLQKYKNIFGISDEDISNANDAGSGKETKTQADTLTEKERKELEKRKKARQKLSDELLSLQEKNQQDEIALMEEGTKKKLKQINADYEAQRNAIAKQSRDWAQENKKAGVSGVNANGLTTDQQSSIDEANRLNAENRIKQTEEVYKSEAAAMRTYLQEYGTFQQRKLAIAQEYADKIAKAQTEGDRLSLEKERDRKLSGMEAEALRMSIDWPSVFGEFGGMFDDIMQPTLEKVKQYMQTDDFKNLQPTDQSEITDAVNRLEQSLGGAGRVSFKQLGKEVDQLRQSMLDLNDAKHQEAEALERLAEAQEAYEDALNNGTEEEKAAADLRLTSAQDEADSASENVRKAEEVAQQNQQSTTKTATSLRANMENVTQGLQKLASGGIQAAYEGLLQLAKGGGENNKMTEIANKLEDVFIIGWIVQIIDVFKDGLSNLVGGLLDGIFNAVSGILSDVLSGDLFVTIGSSIMKGVGNIFEALTFGGFSHWGNNVAETKETIERLTTRNEALIDSIDRLNETMKEARGSETVKATEKAIELQQKVNENYRDIAAARAHYQGKHHSWSKYFNDWLDGVMGNPNFNTGHNDWEVYQRMNEIAGFQIKSRTDFLSITPEQMAEMLADADIKQLLVDIGEGGYGAKMVATLEDFADQAGKIEELREQMYESLTQISFDSLYDSFIDTLMDMDASAEDFADNFSEYMMKALLANKVGEMMYDDLESWYEKFGESMKDGELTADEMASLREDWDKLVEEGLALRDNIAAATGYDQTGSAQQQQASAGYSVAASQDSVDVLSGRMNAVYECELRIEQNGSAMRNIADEVRGIIAQSYIELQQINENTGAIVKPIQQMQKDIEQVKLNTAKL